MATGSDHSGLWIDCSSAPCSEVEQPMPSQNPMTEQSRATSSSLNAAEWPLRRYGRFTPGGLGATSGSWKVLESNKESGFLVLTIVISGHFFISRGKEVLEGFSLIDASQWLKVVRNGDSMLFGSKAKNKHRMFRVQFTGDSKSKAEEDCHSCVQKLADYVPVQVIDPARQEPPQSLSLLPDDEMQMPDAEKNIAMQQTYVMASNIELPIAYRFSGWNAEDLSSFIHLCLLDQSFPAFVEEVEKQLKKIADS
ncbi:hypothetical protein JRQ81_016768 [Phrynocephalus forsythii]|uniref:Meiotic recombination protein REC114 n=1 Tax=Phrynocephalus forsythii TaxID=171643 RepID=A0A9Q1B0W5_9SAUR|nr:hypothetical protein JRQ81_016768 [Phrynocephalus forsythii]